MVFNLLKSLVIYDPINIILSDLLVHFAFDRFIFIEDILFGGHMEKLLVVGSWIILFYLSEHLV